MDKPVIWENSEKIPMLVSTLMSWDPPERQNWMEKRIVVNRCPTCNRIFAYKRERKFCSKECYSESKKGISFINNGSFKNNHTPWNKGITGYSTSKKVNLYKKK